MTFLSFSLTVLFLPSVLLVYEYLNISFKIRMNNKRVKSVVDITDLSRFVKYFDQDDIIKFIQISETMLFHVIF